MTSFDQYLDLHDTVLHNLDSNEVAIFAESLRRVFERDGTLWTAGNGGSASNASHAQCDLSKGVFTKNHLKPRVVCLNDMVGTASAWANDYGYDQGIANMCRNFVRPNDALLLISGSGNSNNIVNALTYAREINLEVFGLSGFDGGILKQNSTYSIHVPSSDMQVIENIHLILVHWLFKTFEEK